MRHARWAMMLAGSAALAGCGGAESTTGPGPADPGPQLESRWDMTVTLRYVRASSELTCDGRTVVGTVNPGEYQYQIIGTFGGDRRFWQSKDYGSVRGTSYELGAGETRNFPNKDWAYTNLQAGDLVRLTMYSTEWDGTARDSYMNHRSNSLNLVASSLRPTGGTSTGRALGVGKSTCGLTLYYDVTINHRRVPAS